MRFALSFVIALTLGSVASGDWPGLPPDCWAESRMFHGAEIMNLWQKNTAFIPLKIEKPKSGVFSPNKGYYFVVEGGRPTGTVNIYAEKDHLIQVTFSNLYGLLDVKWINEKLLFMRPWWGRIMGTDLIYDVEKETVIYAETITDGHLAQRQYLESCPQHGCECIKKR